MKLENFEIHFKKVHLWS